MFVVMIDLIVDSHGAGAYVTIGDALAAAEPGDRLIIRPGTYHESLVVEKSVEIVGQGDRRDIVIEAVGEPVLRFTKAAGRIAHLTLHQLGDPEARIGVEVVEAQVVLEYCDILSECAVCLDIFSDADCVVQHNRIHGSTDTGLVLFLSSSCVVAFNDIFDHARAAVVVYGGAPTVRCNHIYGNRGFGIMHWGGNALLEGNHIYSNTFAGVYVLDGMPVLRGNRVTHGRESGVFVDHARAILEDNEIFFNRHFGVQVFNRGYVTLRHNRITSNGMQALSFFKRSKGILEDNDLGDAEPYNAGEMSRCSVGTLAIRTLAMRRRRGCPVKWQAYSRSWHASQTLHVAYSSQQQGDRVTAPNMPDRRQCIMTRWRCFGKRHPHSRNTHRRSTIGRKGQ